MKNPWFIPVATLLVGAAVGYISGRNTSPSADAAAAAEAPAPKARSAARGGSGGADGPLGRRSARGSSTEQIVRTPGSSNRIQALMDFYANLTPEQLEDEARKLENLPMSERMMASFLLFGRWGESDPAAAMEFAGTMGFTGGFVRPTILQSWAGSDPAGAARYYADNPREFAMMGMMGGGRGPMGGQGGAAIIATEWARQDPEAALAWANSLTTTEKSQALDAVVSEIATTDPARAAAMLAGLQSEDKGEAYRLVATQYGASDFAAAQNWIRTLPADEQASALAAAISGLSRSDPEAAARQVNQMPQGEARDSAVEDVVRDLARLSTQSAADFIKQQTSEDAQRGAVRHLMSAWAPQNPTAALAYAKSFGAGPVQDNALQSYVWSNRRESPAELVKVAESISDDGDRARTVGMTAMRWMREDETAARAYIAQTPAISDEARERILEAGGDRGRGGGRGPGGGRRGRD